MTRLHVLAAVGLLAGTTRAEDPKTLTLVQTIPLSGKPGRLDHMALDADGDRLFIANLSNDSLDIVDLKAGRLARQIPGQRKAQGVAYAPALGRVYLGNGVDGVCTAFDGKSLAALHSVKLPEADNVRFDAKTGLVYVAHAEHALTAFDARTYEVKAAVKLPGPPEAFQIDPDRRRLYVNCLKPATVAVVDLAKHEVVAKYPLTKAEANYPLALDPAGGRVFVGCRKEPMVVTLDAATGKELAGVPIPGDIDDLFYDARRKRLYATCGEGFVAVLGEKAGGDFELIEKVPTRKLARTGLYDPAGGRLFVVLPADGKEEPVLRVYRPSP
jgi:DNA-binding beta-propeller fold protein YncE